MESTIQSILANPAGGTLDPQKPEHRQVILERLKFDINMRDLVTADGLEETCRLIERLKPTPRERESLSHYMRVVPREVILKRPAGGTLDLQKPEDQKVVAERLCELDYAHGYDLAKDEAKPTLEIIRLLMPELRKAATSSIRTRTRISSDGLKKFRIPDPLNQSSQFKI